MAAAAGVPVRENSSNVLENLIVLSASVKLYVPSTVNINETADNSAEVRAAEEAFSGWFGGATAYRALGVWKSPVAGLVHEAITIVESFCNTADLEANISAVVSYARSMKERLGQEAVSLEVQGKLYLI